MFEVKDPTGQPRWVALVIGLGYYLVLLPLFHCLLPWVVSLLTCRHGWNGDCPSWVNLLGITGIMGGAGGFLWVLVTGLRHWDRMPKRVKLGLTPPYLLTDGPYAHTRHPIYLSALALWLGWAAFFGGLAVLTGFILLWVTLQMVVPREERALEVHFGEAYRQYQANVPRWLGKSQR